MLKQINIKLVLQFVLATVGLTGLLSGCSTLSDLKNARKSFQVGNLWVYQTTKDVQTKYRKINRMSPVLFNDLVIQANSVDGLVALKRSNSRLVWRLDIQNGVEAPIAVDKNKIYFGANDGQVYSVDAETGNVLWTYPVRVETLSEPLVADGVVYVLTGNNTLYALDAETGKQKWVYSRIDPSNLSIRGGSKPLIKGNNLYAGFSDGAIVSLNPANGAVKWERALNRNKRFKDIDSNPVVDGEFLYLLGFDDSVYCLRAATGEIVWKFERGGYGSVLITGNRLVFASTFEEVIALEKDTGKQLWVYKLSDGIATSPSLFKGMVVFGESSGALVFADSGSGKRISDFYPGRGVFSKPTVDEAKNEVYFISNEANLYKIQAKWGYR
jgi:outer membrane protein assembly factor BamB